MSAASKKTQSPKSPHSYEARKDTTIQSHIIEDGWCPWLLGRLSNRGQPRCRGAKETCATSSLLGKNPRPMMWLPLWQVTNLLRRMAGLSPRGRNVPGSYPYESECPGSGCVTCDGCREELDESSPSCHADEHAHAHDQSHEGDSSVHLHAHGAGALASRKMSLVKAACLFSALCFHSVAEGMGLGSATHAPMVVSLAAAILVHKGLAAFALGAALCHDPELSMFQHLLEVFWAGLFHKILVASRSGFAQLVPLERSCRLLHWSSYLQAWQPLQKVVGSAVLRLALVS